MFHNKMYIKEKTISSEDVVADIEYTELGNGVNRKREM